MKSGRIAVNQTTVTNMSAVGKHRSAAVPARIQFPVRPVRLDLPAPRVQLGRQARQVRQRQSLCAIQLPQNLALQPK